MVPQQYSQPTSAETRVLSVAELNMLYGRITARIIAIFGAKGGIGKSLMALATAIMLAMQGKVVVLVDLDGNPGLTELYLMMDSDPAHREYIQEMLRSNAAYNSVSRFLLQPALGMFDLLLNIELADIISNLPATVAAAKQYAQEEYEQTWPINPATIVDETLAFYQSNPTKVHAGKVYLMPNGGSFDSVVAQSAARKANKTSYNPLTMLLEGFAGTQQEFINQGLQPPDYFVIDTAGELGLIPDVAAFVADDIILPYKKSSPSVAGVCNTVTNIQAVNRTRPADRRVKIHKPIGNFWHGTRGYGNARMQEVGVTPSPIHIPEDLATGQIPDEIGQIPFSCHPLSAGMKSIKAYLEAEGILVTH